MSDNQRLLGSITRALLAFGSDARLETMEDTMATWRELSLECLRVAKMLAGKGYWRSSVNRAYYAAYCVVTSELVARDVRFARGWNNPAHEQLLDFDYFIPLISFDQTFLSKRKVWLPIIWLFRRMSGGVLGNLSVSFAMRGRMPTTGRVSPLTAL
ncbi:hypothetical protein FJZ31_28360 [Candidatus Poribacteria bacterium]|nr:hypothetical protein [Candidatus Poribacteria bacterium]